MLPDDLLVEIFNSYLNKFDPFRPIFRNAWRVLVRVCRRWGYLVYASPRYLKLQLEYCGKSPMSEVPDAWKVLPLILVPGAGEEGDQKWDNMVAALESEHYKRINGIYLSNMTPSSWERFTAVMQKPFPELTSLTRATQFFRRPRVVQDIGIYPGNYETIPYCTGALRSPYSCRQLGVIQTELVVFSLNWHLI